MDMREVPEGSVLDEFHFDMWAGFLRFMLDRPEVVSEFEGESGRKFLTRPSGIDAMIDDACGFDREAENAQTMALFAQWATETYWGDETHLCPKIISRLSGAA